MDEASETNRTRTNHSDGKPMKKRKRETLRNPAVVIADETVRTSSEGSKSYHPSFAYNMTRNTDTDSHIAFKSLYKRREHSTIVPSG